MYKILVALVFIFIAPLRLISQILPSEGSKLNYRLIGFSFPGVPGVDEFKIEIASGNYNTEDSFKKNIVRTFSSKKNKLIADVPYFGRQYTWRTAWSANSTITKSEFHHFNTGIIPEVDTSVTRLRILKSAKEYKDAYVFLDGNRALYDMNGQPVWYLPDITGVKIENRPKPEDALLRDLKLSPQGTITFLIEDIGAYEINYNGDILWKGPNDGKVSGDATEYYHHELTRLANGHYMVIGSEFEVWNGKTPDENDSAYMITSIHKVNHDSTARYQKAPFGTLIEYDEKGTVVWSWRSSDYFKRSDIYYHTRRGRPELAVHENSFYFDERANIIYVGFRNISRLVTVKYPGGNVLNTYGEIYKPGVPETGNGMFCRQHSCRKSEKGYLYLYDNNSCAVSGLPNLIMFKEPQEGNNLEKIWEYQCTVEGDISGQQGPYQFPIGGNVIELPGHSLFAVMSGQYDKVFIVSMDKKILWSAIPEKWNKETQKWDMVYQYRASIITDPKDLERLIWNAEK